MIIEFKISNGDMKINADTFFQEATKAKIRKMLKWFKAAGPDPEAVQEMKGWLQGEIQNLKKTGRTRHWNMGSPIKLTERYKDVLEIIEKMGL